MKKHKATPWKQTEFTKADESVKRLYLLNVTYAGDGSDPTVRVTFDLEKARHEAGSNYRGLSDKQKKNCEIWIEGYDVPTNNEILSPYELLCKAGEDDLLSRDPDYYEKWENAEGEVTHE